MPLTDEQAEELYGWVKDIHAALTMKRRESTTPTVGRVVNVSTKLTHNPKDPVVRLLPKGWQGEDYRGRCFSQCSPAFLGMLSHLLDSFADKNEQKGETRFARWDRENAETARRWRASMESTPTTAPASDGELEAAF